MFQYYKQVSRYSFFSSFNRLKNGNYISEISSLNGRYEINDKENIFIIRDTNVDDAGLYACSIPELDESAQIKVVGKCDCLSSTKLLMNEIEFDLIASNAANVYLEKIPDNLVVVEGEKLQIHCKAFGTDPKITWKIGKSTNLVIKKILMKTCEEIIQNAIFNRRY